jgi:hypothetical protein
MAVAAAVGLTRLAAQTRAAADPIIAAAGDIACDRTPGAKADEEEGSATCQMGGTAALLADLARTAPLAAVLPLGDEQYPDGALEQFRGSYQQSWGSIGVAVHPVPGNHEYHTPNASGYYSYFGAAAGDPTRGYYSYDLGRWHLIALNSNCAAVGGCARGSPEERWLRADLAAHPGVCILSYWHQPRFSSAKHHSDTTYAAFWAALTDAAADVVLAGHDHSYERFAPQTSSGAPDSARGVREFVVGTGGKSHYGFTAIEPNSEVRNAETFGVLVLTLHPDRYDWRFVPVAGQAFTDVGSQACHRRGRA